VSAIVQLNHRGLGHRERLEKIRKNELVKILSGDTPYCTMVAIKAEFSMSVLVIHPSGLAQKLREGPDIISRDSDILMNSKLEFLQGAMPHTRRLWG
jgi:hypothetical protein